MKKAILLFGAVPLLCGGLGFGAGLFLKPAAPEIAAPAADHAEAGTILNGLAEGAPGAAHAPPAGEVAEDTEPHAQPAPQVAESAHAPADPHGTTAEAAPDDSNVVTVGRISVPVYKPNSVTYVVADFGVAVDDRDMVAHYSIAENTVRLRDAILTSMHGAAETSLLRGPAIDSDALASLLAEQLRPQFRGLREVLFLTLHKTDVPRS